MVSILELPEIFYSDKFKVYILNSGTMASIYLPNSYGCDVWVAYTNDNKLMYKTFKVVSQNYRPRIGFDYCRDIIDLETITKEELSKIAHNIMENFKFCRKQVLAYKKLNDIKKDF